MRTVKFRFDKRSSVILWIGILSVLWEMTAYTLQIRHDDMALQKMPYLHDVVIHMLQDSSSLFGAGAITLSRALGGLVLGGSIGFLAAIFLSASPLLEKMIFPYMIISQMIPVLALAPLVYSIVRDQDAARVILSAFITFFPVTINMHSGLKSVSQDKRDLMYSYASGKVNTLIKLMIPASLPYLFTGLKLAAPSAVTAGILVEMLGADNGIGIKIISGIYYGAAGALAFWSAVLAAALLGVSSYYLINFLQYLLLPWQRKTVMQGGGEL